MNDKVEPLYYGDVRIDTLCSAIEGQIRDRLADHDIPVVVALGVLDVVRQRFLEDLGH